MTVREYLRLDPKTGPIYAALFYVSTGEILLCCTIGYLLTGVLLFRNISLARFLSLCSCIAVAPLIVLMDGPFGFFDRWEPLALVLALVFTLYGVWVLTFNWAKTNYDRRLFF